MMKFTIYDLRFTAPHLTPRIWCLALCLILLATCHPAPATPFVQTFYNSDGTPQTNAITMVAYPAQNTWIVVGTNLYYGGAAITLQPTTNGYLSNSVSPGGYRLTFAGTTVPLYVNILNTTSVLSLSSYVTNAPVIAGSYLSAYGVLTNMLGYAPATNTPDGIKFALGYTPPTNSVTGITNALGYSPTPGSFASLTNVLGYVPATNGLTALTNVFGFYPLASNTLALKAALGYTPATNSYAGITNALGGTLQEISLPQLGYVGVSNLNGSMLTNRGTGTIICWTNLALGVAPTLGAPDGSMLIATNGNIYSRSNATWVNLK